MVQNQKQKKRHIRREEEIVNVKELTGFTGLELVGILYICLDVLLSFGYVMNKYYEAYDSMEWKPIWKAILCAVGGSALVVIPVYIYMGLLTNVISFTVLLGVVLGGALFLLLLAGALALFLLSFVALVCGEGITVVYSIASVFAVSLAMLTIMLILTAFGVRL